MMNVWRSPLWLFSALLALATLSACTTVPVSSHPPFIAPTLLLLPADTLHAELLQGSEKLNQQMTKRLERNGFTVKHIADEQLTTYKKAALEASGAVYDPKVGDFIPLDRSNYRHKLVKLLAFYGRYDAVVDVQLILRTAEVIDGQAVWDNAERDIEFFGKKGKKTRMPDSAKGVSLRVEAFSPNGAQISLGFGGVALPYMVDYSKGKSGLRLKQQFFTDREIRQGVKNALLAFNAEVKAN